MFVLEGEEDQPVTYGKEEGPDREDRTRYTNQL